MTTASERGGQRSWWEEPTQARRSFRLVRRVVVRGEEGEEGEEEVASAIWQISC